MRVVVHRDAMELSAAAAEIFRARVAAKPDLTMAVPAGRTPRRMYGLLRDRQACQPLHSRRHSRDSQESRS